MPTFVNWREIAEKIKKLEKLNIKKDKQLHVFNNGVIDVVIAYDPDDAIKVWEEYTGDKYDLDENEEFEKVPDESLFTLHEDETIDPDLIPDGAILVEKSAFYHTYKATCHAWADARGRCFLGSTEY